MKEARFQETREAPLGCLAIPPNHCPCPCLWEVGRRGMGKPKPLPSPFLHPGQGSRMEPDLCPSCNWTTQCPRGCGSESLPLNTLSSLGEASVDPHCHRGLHRPAAEHHSWDSPGARGHVLVRDAFRYHAPRPRSAMCHGLEAPLGSILDHQLCQLVGVRTLAG